MCCIVCDTPSLSPRGVCVQPHLKTSEFVWMSDGPTPPLCSSCGDYKDLMRGWKASTKLSHRYFFVWERKKKKLFRRWLVTYQTSQFQHPLTLPRFCKPANPSGPNRQKRLDSNIRLLLLDLENVFLTCVRTVYIFGSIAFQNPLFWFRKVSGAMLQNLFFIFQC